MRTIEVVADGYVLGGTLHDDFLMIKITLDGKLDTSWGTDGIFIKDYEGTAEIITDIAITDNEDLLSCGVRYEYRVYYDTWDAIVIKLKPDGTLDSTFSNNGFLTFTPDNGEKAYQIVPVGNDFLISYQSFEILSAALIDKRNEFGELVPGFESFYGGGYSDVTISCPIQMEISFLSTMMRRITV
jgi:hypothetical protein